jgi:hypothetical protein
VGNITTWKEKQDKVLGGYDVNDDSKWNYEIDLARSELLKAIEHLANAERHLARIGYEAYLFSLRRKVSGLLTMHSNLGHELRKENETT